MHNKILLIQRIFFLISTVAATVPVVQGRSIVQHTFPFQDSLRQQHDSLNRKQVRQIYKTVPAALSTAATDVVYGEAFKTMPVTSFQSAVLGRITGLHVTQSSGQPAEEGLSVTLRGRTPLVLIDGIPRGLTVFDLEEIESVTVLKDAMATAMLGVRGANGAILVTTRKGTVGRQQISFTAQTAFQKPLNNMYSQPLDAYNYGVLYNEAQQNDDRLEAVPRPPAYSEAALAAYRDGSDPYLYPDVNWQEEVLKKSSRFDRYTLTTNGGNEMARYFVALEHFNQTGLFKTSDDFNYNTNNDFKSYTIRSNVDLTITPQVTAGIYLLGRILNTNNPGNNGSAGIFNSILSTPNNAYPALNPDGSYGGSQQFQTNILGQTVASGYYQNYKRDVLTDFYMKRTLEEIMPGLWIKGRASFTSYISENLRRNKTLAVFQLRPGTDPATYVQYGTNGAQANSNGVESQNRIDYQEVSLGFTRTFGASHGLDVLVLANRDNTVTQSNLPLTYTGTSAYLSYNYQQKYVAELAFGLNGSNRYKGGKTKYGFMPSLGLGWNINQESFLADVSWLNNLKLSGTYGITGWDDPGYFSYLTRYFNSASPIFGTSAGGQTAVEVAQFGNPNITFEKAAKLNLGLQGVFLDNRLSFHVDYYNNRHYDQLIQRGKNTTLLGLPWPDENIGRNRYQGWEFDAAWQQAVGAGFNYHISANASLQDSRVLFNDEVNQPYSWMERTGRRIGQRFGYIAEGLFQSDADILGKATIEGYTPQPGDIKYKDLNGDGLINQFDVAAIGNQQPTLLYGLTAGFTFKAFDLSVFGQGVANRDIYLNGNSFWEFQSNGLGQAYQHHLERWTPENAAVAEYPRLSLGTNINNHVPSTYWLRSGGFLRLRHVELGFTLPANLARLAWLQSARLFASGTNLLTITSGSLNKVDPEIFSGGYPNQQLINLGVNIKL